jgi:septal ring factor EnvC (AmiA/AmiB activator)
VLSRRLARPRRPWLLIVAALLLAVLSTVLWAKWAGSRGRAEQLQAELKQVYAEAEALRTQAARAQQRIAQLEQQMRALERARPGGAAKEPRPAGAKSPEAR